MMNPFLAPYLSAAAAAAAASHSASSSSMGSSMWQPSDRESVPSVASNHGAFTPTPSPPVTQTSKNHIREDQRYEHSGSEEQGANGGGKVFCDHPDYWKSFMFLLQKSFLLCRRSTQSIVKTLKQSGCELQNSILFMKARKKAIKIYLRISNFQRMKRSRTECKWRRD